MCIRDRGSAVWSGAWPMTNGSGRFWVQNHCAVIALSILICTSLQRVLRFRHLSKSATRKALWPFLCQLLATSQASCGSRLACHRSWTVIYIRWPLTHRERLCIVYNYTCIFYWGCVLGRRNVHSYKCNMTWGCWLHMLCRGYMWNKVTLI